MAAERVVTELVIDASGAETGSARYTAAMQRAERATESAVLKQDAVEKAVSKVTVGLDRQVQRASQVDRQYQRLAAAIDPVVAAQQRYERAVAITERAVRLGRITQDEATRTLAQYQARLTSVSTAADQTAAAVGRAGFAFRGAGGAFQMAGYQLGDFAVQVASGQGVIRPLIQQGTQMVQAFGPWGAVLGAAGAVAGSLAIAFLDLGESTEETKKAQEGFNRAIEDYIDLTANDNDAARDRTNARIRETQGILAQAIAQRDLNNAALEEQRLRLQRRKDATGLDDPFVNQKLNTEIADIDFRLGTNRDLNIEDQRRIDLLQLKSELGDYFSEIEDGLKKQSDLQAALSELERGGIEAAREARRDADAEAKKAAEERLKVAKAAADELNRWLDLQQEALKAEGERVKAQTDLERAQMAANDNLEGYIRKLEDAATVDALTTTEKKVQQAIIEAQNKLYDQQGEKLRDLEQVEKDRIATAVRQTEELDKQRKAAEAHAKEVERVAQRAEDQLSDAMGDTFFDYLTGKTTSFWQTFKNLGLRAIADTGASAAASLFRPAIHGITNWLMGSTSISSSAGIGSAPQSGGGFSFGNFSSLPNLFNMSTGGNPGIFSGLTRGIDSFGASVFGLSGGAASAAATQAAASTYGISAGQAAMLSNSGAISGGATLSGLLGAGGIGLGAGMLLSSLTGNRTVGMLGGAGSGALAGFMMGGPIGAVVGGAAGLLGGLFGGGKKKIAAGHTNIDVGPDGLLRVGETGARGVDPNATIQQSQQAVSQVNQFLQAYGLRATRGGSISQGQATGPQSAEAFIAQLVGQRSFSSSDAVLQTVLNNTAAGSLAGIASDLDFGKLYKQLSELQRPANDARDAIEALSKAFDENTKRATSLGLSAEKLAEGTRLNFDQDIERSIRAITDPLGLALDDFAEVEKARLDYAKKIGADIVDVERLNMLERQKILQQSGMDIKAWLDGQLLGNTSTLTGGGRLSEAQSQLQAAMASNDNSRVLGLADYIAGQYQALFGGTSAAASGIADLRGQVAQYGRSLGLPGFDTGGSFTVGAPNMGWGGVDATLVRFRANQGEQVTVTPPGVTPGGASSRDIGELALILTRMHGEAAGTRRAVEQQSAELRKLGQMVDLLMNRAMATKSTRAA